MSQSRLLNLKLALIVALICGAGILAYGISQESAVGSLKGTAITRESGAPVAADVHLTSVAKVDGETLSYHVKCDADGSFVLGNVVAGAYTLNVQSKAHSMRDTHINIAEGTTQTVEVELQPDEPSLDLYIHQHVFTPGEVAEITCHGFLDSDALDVRVYKVDLSAFLMRSGGSLQRLLGSQSYMSQQDQSGVNLGGNPSLSLAQSMNVPITKRDGEGVFTQRIKLPVLKPGLYVAAVRAAGMQRIGWAMVTSLGLVTKTAPGGALAYVVDLKTGDPVPSADVSMFAESRSIASGKTDSHGLLNLLVPAGFNSETEGTVVARSGDSFAFVSSTMSSLPASDNVVYAYTERPVYRPGQVVFFKGIVRTRANEGYKVPAALPVVVEVRDVNDTLIYRATKTTDKFGCYAGSLHLSSEAATGSYVIRASVQGRSSEEPSATFSVAAYRKPEFSVKTTFDKPHYTRGEWVRAKISVNYYFGAPVANAKVNYTVQRSPYWLFETDEESISEGSGYSDYGGYGESVKDGEVKTDANGEAVVEFPASWPQPKGADAWDSDMKFNVSANVMDKGGAYATGEGSVLVTRGEFGISVSPDSWIVTPGSEVNVVIEAKDYDKRPIKRQNVTVTLARQTWSDDGELNSETLEQKQVTTDGSGAASLRLPVKRAGGLLITAQSRDSRGNTIIGTSYLYSCAQHGEQGDFGPTAAVKIVADKRTYSPGDTAKVLILTKKPGATALVTVEGSRVYDSRTVRLSGSSTMVSLPIRDTYKPNFYIAVCFVRDKQFVQNEKMAKVSIRSQSLRIAIQPNKRRYKPGEKADYKLKVTDSKGRPVSAELSLGVVDEAIYAIEPESTTPITDFFYAKRENQVRTGFSFPEIYLSDPDKAGPPLKDQPLKIRVRKRFLDTAYWNPDIVTGPTGEADVSFTLPDNLTTWRATVRGITADTACGEARNTVISQQDMLVRLEMSRFLVQGDESQLTAVVHNYTGKDQRVKVRLRAPGLRVHDDIERSVFVANEGSERIDWSVSATKPGSFAIGVRAEGETAGDAVELDLSVKPHGEERTTATNAVISNGADSRLTINVRNDSIPEVTRLKVRLAPSLASTMLGSLDYLAQYPYGCTEQTVSCFLPDVILFRSLSSLGVRNPRLQAQLPDMVRKGFARLYRFQLIDGGWSWCEYGKADPWMTAYVLYALVQAREAGFPVNQDVMDKAIHWLAQAAPSHKIRIASRAYSAYVLALCGRDSSDIMEEIAGRRYVNNEALAVLALGFQKLGKPDRAKAMLARLFEHAISDGDIHWQGIPQWDGGDVEPTALALDAVLKISPSDPRAYGIVRWLMKQRRDDYWYSTRGTAMALYAMSEFLKMTKELAPNYDATVLVNGRVAGRAHFDKASIFNPQVEITVQGRDLRKGRNELRLTKSGPGNLYYSTNLVQYIARDPIPALVSGAGLSIERAYFKPRPEYFQNESMREIGSPISGCDVGDVVLVRLTVRSSSYFSHMLVEDCIPAGCEIVDRGNVAYDEWYHWWSGQDIRDDKVSFYVDDLGRGKHVIEYQMRAGFGGSYFALPAQVFSMYDPAIRATTGETEFDVR
jgi:uncharacterized protein YfaS (alpha-2-macroglobulin family)